MSLRSFPLPLSFSHPPVASYRPSPPPFARRPFPSFPSSIAIPFKTSSKSPSRAAWQRPVYVYPDPIPEFAKAVIFVFPICLRYYVRVFFLKICLVLGTNVLRLMFFFAGDSEVRG
ncbi:unnamed protein product [Musa textilis]